MTATKKLSPKKSSANPAASSPAVRFRWASLRSMGFYYHNTCGGRVVGGVGRGTRADGLAPAAVSSDS